MGLCERDKRWAELVMQDWDLGDGRGHGAAKRREVGLEFVRGGVNYDWIRGEIAGDEEVDERWSWPREREVKRRLGLK